MKPAALLLAILLVTFGAVMTASADESGRIHGKIFTVDGDTYEGLIRWDKNEASWVDILDGTKELDSRKYRKSRRRSHSKRRTSIDIFGIRIGEGSTTYYESGSASSGLRIGHLKSMEVIDDDLVLLTLKSGEEVELENSSTDIGSNIREIVIEDPDEGEIEFSWDDIDRVEFEAADDVEGSGFGERLYGTLTTRRDDSFTGWVTWDMDEVFTSDVIDGNEKRRKRKLQFSKIAAIERYSSSAAQITLKSGDDIVLRGSNDVNDENRGIIISDPGFGQVVVKWDEFEKLELTEAPKAPQYKDFDGGSRLYGTLVTEDGDEYTGDILWDYDEGYTWELLNGETHDMDFDIEFGLIKTIEKKSHRASRVTVLDGREFVLRGCNDVDEDNKGIVITTDDDDEVVVDWDEFERIEFKKK